VKQINECCSSGTRWPEGKLITKQMCIVSTLSLITKGLCSGAAGDDTRHYIVGNLFHVVHVVWLSLIVLDRVCMKYPDNSMQWFVGAKPGHAVRMSHGQNYWSRFECWNWIIIRTHLQPYILLGSAPSITVLRCKRWHFTCSCINWICIFKWLDLCRC